MRFFVWALFLFRGSAFAETVIENFEDGKLHWEARIPLSKTNPEYKIEVENGNHFLHAAPEKGVEGKIIFKRFSIDLKKTPHLKWRWRILELPPGGYEGVPGKNDSAGGVYVYLQKGILRRLLKFTFSSTRTDRSFVKS